MNLARAAAENALRPPLAQTAAVEPPTHDDALNPTLHRLLQHCGLARTWVRGEGAWLFDDHGGRFLDFYAQYGATALGHGHPAVVAALQAAILDRTPALVQPYRAPYAAALARRLALLTGLPHCMLLSTGAEVVEAAIKAVRRRSGRDLILCAAGSYHGKTLGALAATGQPAHTHGFGPLPAAFHHLPFGDLDALSHALSQHRGHVAALLLEPIQGERGVYLPPPDYLRHVRALCTQHDVALIFDEVQTGLGRTGTLLAAQHDGVTPDLLLLGKALGGGLFPLSACLFAHAWWDDDFALRHSATFANHNIASRVALAVLDQLVGPDPSPDAPALTPATGGLIAHAAALGTHLQRRLQSLPARFPHAVSAVRGRGLMAAIDLCAAPADDGFLPGYLVHQGLWAYAFAATLAARHAVLVLPTLGCGHTLRIAPPLIVDRAQIDSACDALEQVFAQIESRDTAALVRGLNAHRPSPPPHGQGRTPPRIVLPAPPPPADLAIPARARSTYAFLVHYTQPEDAIFTDPALSRLSPDELRCYHDFLSALPPGVVLRAPTVRSPTGAQADGYIIAVPMLPAHMLGRGRRSMRGILQAAVDLAARMGADVVGLGGFTTPYSGRGRDVLGRGPAITTGNTLTALCAVDALCHVAHALGRPLPAQHVGIVGARGSVGALCARLLASRRPRRLSLFGNPHSDPAPLHALATDLRTQNSPHSASTQCAVAPDLDALHDCDLILSASGAARPLLDRAPIRAGTVICDVARPFDAGPALRARRDVLVLDGGLVALPDPALRFGPGNLLGLPTGIQLACLSETLLLALAGHHRDCGIGDDIDLQTAHHIAALAAAHGFRLATPPAPPASFFASAAAPVRTAPLAPVAPAALQPGVA